MTIGYVVLVVQPVIPELSCQTKETKDFSDFEGGNVTMNVFLVCLAVFVPELSR
jgi:hypothetical protein